MSHLLCPISRQPVQFCESAACFIYLFILDGGVGLLVFIKELYGQRVYVRV